MADQLPADVVQAAADAFTQGFQVAAGASAILAATAAVLAGYLLRDTTEEPEEAEITLPARAATAGSGC